ncbi:hypothetical protein ACFQ0X_21950 [Streptomyces rectiviolaceus]|uniref:HTH-type transcriptional repressor Sco4008 C-terminal domain-containing protein n=1 Tax=Streptomyces rectiviolaceus TaxID=332591 RepID=A0ABP6M9Y4_9ACTN
MASSSGPAGTADPAAAEVDAYRPKIEAIASAQHSGSVIKEIGPPDNLALVLGLTAAWASASPALQSLAPEAPWSPERLRRHRAAMTAAVQAFAAP